MNKYTFLFKEVNFGSIEITSDHEPDKTEVIDNIMSSGAFFKDTEYEDIRLVDTEKLKSFKNRDYER